MSLDLNTLASKQAVPEVSTTEDVKDTEGKTVVIKADNPTPEEMQTICADLQTKVKEKYNFNVDVKPIKFNFKKSVDKESQIETTRQALELPIPVPSVEGVVAIIQDQGKGFELLMEAIESVVVATAREIISEDTSINAKNFPFEKLTWDAIANLPKAQRRGGGIPKEVWEDFVKDYIAVMPGVTGKSVEQVTNAAKILGNRLAQVKTNEPVLKLLMTQLSIYAENSPNFADYSEVVGFLLEKAENFLNIPEEELLANL